MVNCENEGSYKMKKQIENTIYSIDEEGNVYGKNNKVLKVTKTGRTRIMFNDGIRRSITPQILKHEYFNYSNYTDKPMKQIENSTYLIDKEGNVYNKCLKLLKVQKTGKVGIILNDNISKCINPQFLKHEYFNYSNYTDKPMKQIENSTYLIDEEGNVYNKHLKLLKVQKTGKVGIYSQYVNIILNDGSQKCIFTKKVSAQMFM